MESSHSGQCYTSFSMARAWLSQWTCVSTSTGPVSELILQVVVPFRLHIECSLSTAVGAD